MAASARLLESQHPNGHMVQLYRDDDDLLAASVANYLAQGLALGEGILVVASEEHETRFLATLDGMGVTTGKAIQAGRMIFLNAEQLLEGIMNGEEPSWEAFERLVKDPAQEVLARSGQVGLRAYGEMVGLLWRKSRFAAAIRLEEFWNTLLESMRFSLFCAYPIDLFDKTLDIDALEPILCSHTHVLPTSRDFDAALNRAIEEVLGPEAEVLKLVIKANFRPARAVIPRAEAIALWLKANLKDASDEILDRARTYYPGPVRIQSPRNSSAAHSNESPSTAV